MKEKAFSKFLLEINVDKEQTEVFISRLSEFNNFLKNQYNDIDSFPRGEITKYADILVQNNSNIVLDFLRALMNYANFTKKYD